MKKRINGRVYDTETAKEIAFYDDDKPWSDFGHKKERLYIKKNKEFFLYGAGHGATRWGHRCSLGIYEPGEGLLPISNITAAAWILNHFGHDKQILKKLPKDFKIFLEIAAEKGRELCDRLALDVRDAPIKSRRIELN